MLTTTRRKKLRKKTHRAPLPNPARDWILTHPDCTRDALQITYKEPGALTRIASRLYHELTDQGRVLVNSHAVQITAPQQILELLWRIRASRPPKLGLKKAPRPAPTDPAGWLPSIRAMSKSIRTGSQDFVECLTRDLDDLDAALDTYARLTQQVVDALAKLQALDLT